MQRDMTIRRHSTAKSVYGQAVFPTTEPVSPVEPSLPTPVDPWPDAPIGFSWTALLDRT